MAGERQKGPGQVCWSGSKRRLEADQRMHKVLRVLLQSGVSRRSANWITPSKPGIWLVEALSTRAGPAAAEARPNPSRTL